MQIQVVVTGRNYDVAEAIPSRLTLDDGASVDDAIAHLTGLLPAGARLPATCLLAVSGTHLGTLKKHSPHELKEGDELVLIAPVAGG